MKARRILAALAAIGLTACNPATPTTTPAGTPQAGAASVDTSAALASCERARANGFGSGPSSASSSSPGACVCMQRTLTAKDFLFLGPLFDIMAMQTENYSVREYRMTAYFEEQARLETPGLAPSARPPESAISAVRERFSKLGSLLGNECIQPASYSAPKTEEPAAAAAPEYYPETTPDAATTPYYEEKK